ncbi:MAG: PilZ domain-containing protein [Sphingomonadales bacterium]|nr:PilZ domain-containing protein [Sphingomonadales bacterium]
MAAPYPSLPTQTPLGRRLCSRVRLRLPAEFISLDGNHRCWLENLSTSGARLLIRDAPGNGAAGYLMFAGHEAFSRVVWHAWQSCGIAFDEMLPLETVIAMRHLAESFPEMERRRHDQSIRDWVQGRGRIVGTG